MQKKITYRFLLLFLLAIIGTRPAKATVEHFYNSIEGSNFAANNSFTVQDDKYGTPIWNKIQKNESALDIVTLQLDEDTSLFLTQPHTLTADVEITYTLANGTVDSLAEALTIYYDTTRRKPFNFRSSFKFYGGYKVKTRILAVYYDHVLSTTYPKVFTLLGDIYINRVYKFNCDSLVSYNTPHYDATNQQLDLSWTPMLGADEYDLEYTFYDSASTVGLKTFGCITCISYTNYDYLFTGQATRVTVQGNSYAMSMVYNHGYVITRIRPVHYDTLNRRIEGLWSSELSSAITPPAFVTNYGYSWPGHMPLFNWQYTAAFAEQGKRKEVTSYFDGTLRNRQSVTINNTLNKAIVGETMYDHQGRAALTTLPAPIDSGKIIFYNNFNVISPGVEYSRHDFDTGSCGFIPPKMDSLTTGSVARGSSGYYSSSNPDKGNLPTAYLPDAQGYPFTQTEYTLDNTGRISRQSIADSTHTLGSGHETKYFYGKPAQEQLDRLFGSEVGNNSHYLENMVMDANGQVSVSYVDANGKTIATALAGQPPGNVHALPSYYPATSLYINLLDEAANMPSPTTVNSSFGLLATNYGRYYFTYRLYPGNYADTTCSARVCTDCDYDIVLMLTDNCGGDNPIIIHYDSNFSLKNAWDTLCGHTNVVDTFSVLLNPGEYNISRTISIDPTAMQFYQNEYMRKNTCIKSYSSFLNQAIANTDFGGCNITCATCLASLGTSSAFLTKYITEQRNAGETTPTHQDTINADTLYAQAVVQCNALCQIPSQCADLYNEMLADVSLGGQYCTYTVLGNGNDTSYSDPTSVLISWYKSPNIPYQNSAGQPDTVVLGNMKYLPQQLSQNQFIKNWKPSWAKSLVERHPEYCYYEYCQMDTASNRYDVDMENTSTFSSAWSQGFINPLGDSSYPSALGHYNINWRDPYFWGGKGSARRKSLMYKMKNYLTINWRHTNVTLSMWQVASLEANCTHDTMIGLNDTNCYPPPSFDTCCAGNQNMNWSLFRGLYLSMKQQQQDSLESIWVVNNGCPYATCIGHSGCDGGWYANKQPRVVDTSYANSQNFTPHTINAANEKAFVLSQEKSNCDSMCKYEAAAWYHKLSRCANLHADSVTLIRRLIEVCDSGCDVYHPFGASTTAHGRLDHDGDRSFEDVLVHVLGVSRNNLNCDSLDITMPPPWNDSNGVTGPQAIFSKPDTCVCNKLTYYYNNYYKPDSTAGDLHYKNFADWLNQNLGGNLSDSNLYALWNLCENSSCFYLTTPMQLPIWLSCCATDTFHVSINNPVADTTAHYTVTHCCLNCADIEGAYRMFLFQNGYGVVDSSHYQQWLEAYLNETFNFDLSYTQYNDFYIKCKDSTYDTITTMPSCFTCSGCTKNIARSLPFTLCNEPMNTVPPAADTNPCYTYLMIDASYNAQNAYTQYIDSVQSTFSANYIKHCMNINDSFHLKMPFDEYHYTLYYFDQAENLVKTVPPDGVYPITSAASLDSVKKYRLGRAGYNPVYPVDSMKTRYWYNTLNSPAQQVTPDGDTSRFYYDRLGRLCLSQNAIQKPYLYSYTKYDALGRIIEVGQLNTNGTKVAPGTFVKNDNTLQNFIRHWHHTQVTHTFYDTAQYTNIPLAQTNLRKRVASITFEDVDDSNFATYDNGIHYAYDIIGSVATLLNDNPHNTIVKQRFKRTDYYYDLQSGKVNELIYEHDSADQFIQIYEYDADNRITDVLTSRDSAYFEHDAGYTYYDHGPLAREVLGQRQVQGMDYAYTLNGWVKGINSSILNPSYDMSFDGNVHNAATASIGRDAFGMTLEYFNGDYRAIGTSKFEAPGLPDTALYNGNIAGATYSIKPLKPKTIGYKYTYDQLNRLNDMVAFTAIDTVNDKWNSPSPVLDFQEKVIYDENGNVFKYVRHGNTIAGLSLAMDSMNYHYKKGKNQLTNVRDAVPAGNYPNDIDDEPSPRNYQYNTIGELAKDSAGTIDTVIWTVYGKIKKLTVHDKSFPTAKDSLVFEYDGLGNRIEKRWYRYVGTSWKGDTTLYQRDAQGNILAIYDRFQDSVRLNEWDMYGSKRLGSLDTTMRVYPKVSVNIGGPPLDSLTTAYLENQKQYELDNHLGSVMVSITDRKWWIDTASLGYGQYYLPNIVSATDRYPYGMDIPGRTYQLVKDSAYTYGYQGSMKDNQVHGADNAYTTEFRELDERLPLWWSIDPDPMPNESPYISMGDNPIMENDVRGNTLQTDKSGQSQTDVKGVAGKYSGLVTIDSKTGMVSIDWSKAPKSALKSPKKLEAYKKKALKDDGFKLIFNLVSSKSRFFYGTENHIEARYRDSKQPIPNLHYGLNPIYIDVITGKKTQNFSFNFSITPYSETNPQPIPKEGYEGAVYIAAGEAYEVVPKQTFEPGTNKPIQYKASQIVPRSEYVYHELNENYKRTILQLPYEQAHKQAGGASDNINDFKYKK